MTAVTIQNFLVFNTIIRREEVSTEVCNLALPIVARKINHARLFTKITNALIVSEESEHAEFIV